MKSKIDKSLKEVWEMKRLAYENYKKSGYRTHMEYCIQSTNEIIKKYNLQFFNEEVSNIETKKVLL